MKKMILLSFFILFCVISCSLDSFQNGGVVEYVPPPPPHRRWTFIMYMAADNDLEPAAIADFNELEAVDLSAGIVSILVLLDRGTGYDATNGDWTDTRLYEVSSDPHGNNATLVSTRLDCAELGLTADTATELDMSDPLVLSRLVQFAKREYAADNYGLLIWGHGTGWRGGAGAREGITPLNAIAVDDQSGHYMSLPSFGTAVSGENFAVIAFDTCFGGLLEVAYQIRNNARYLVASEGIIPSTGWNYAGVFTSFLQDGGLTAEKFADRAVASFSSQYSGTPGAVIAKIDLSAVDALFAAFETFTGTLAANISAVAVRDTVLYEMLHNTEVHYFSSYPSDLYIDMYDFSRKMIDLRASITSNTAQQILIQSAGLSFQDALSAAVPQSWAQNGTANKCGVFVIPLSGPSIPMASHDIAYINGSISMEKSAFVAASEHWVPHTVPKADSFLDKLFYWTY
jgi:hypothetical protein